MKAAETAGQVDARMARCAQHHVPLWCEHVSNVRLDLVALLPTLIQPVNQEERAPRCHHLPQEAVEWWRMLEAKVGIDVVPCLGECFGIQQKAPLQVRHLDHDGHELALGGCERQRNQLRQQGGLPCCGRRSQQSSARRIATPTLGTVRILPSEPGAQAVSIAEQWRRVRRGRSSASRSIGGGHTQLKCVPPGAGGCIHDCRVLVAHRVQVPRAERLERCVRQLARRVVPRMQPNGPTTDTHGAVSSSLHVHPGLARPLSHRQPLTGSVGARPAHAALNQTADGDGLGLQARHHRA